MKNPKIKTTVIHSQINPAWNIIGSSLGGKYKIARIPYITTENHEISNQNRREAYEHAKFISYCFNHSNEICNGVGPICRSK